jgi:hypothetical protein
VDVVAEVPASLHLAVVIRVAIIRRRNRDARRTAASVVAA